MKQILIFGDSWPSGEELSGNEKSFPILLSDNYQFECKRYCQPSTGIPHLILQLERALADGINKDTHALFCLSSASRSITFQNNQWQEIHARGTDVHANAYFKYIHSKELEDFSANCYILALQKMCQEFGILDHYISCWSHLNLYLPGIDKSKFLNEGKTTLVDILGCGISSSFINDVVVDSEHYTIQPNICHPNAIGHRIIAEKIADWLKI